MNLLRKDLEGTYIVEISPRLPLDYLLQSDNTTYPVSIEGFGRGGRVLLIRFSKPSLSLTLNVYSHVLPDMGDSAAGAMHDALE